MSDTYVFLSIATLTSIPDGIETWNKSYTTNGRNYSYILLSGIYFTPLLGAITAIVKNLIFLAKKIHDYATGKIAIEQEKPKEIIFPQIEKPLSPKINIREPEIKIDSETAPEKPEPTAAAPTTTEVQTPITPQVLTALEQFKEPPPVKFTPAPPIQTAALQPAIIAPTPKTTTSSRKPTAPVKPLTQTEKAKIISQKVASYRSSDKALFLRRDEYKIREKNKKTGIKIEPTQDKGGEFIAFLVKYREFKDRGERHIRVASAKNLLALEVAFYASLEDLMRNFNPVSTKWWKDVWKYPNPQLMLDWLQEEIVKGHVAAAANPSRATSPIANSTRTPAKSPTRALSPSKRTPERVFNFPLPGSA